LGIKKYKMTPPSVNQNILQPKLIVPSRDFDPHDGDLVLAINNSEVSIHPLLAACSKNGQTSPPAYTVHLLRRTESPLIFQASRVVLMDTPIAFGAGVLPHICLFAITTSGKIQYNADRYFVGRDKVIEAMSREERLRLYIPWFEIHFP
jgi:hypothetical protein